MEPSINFLVAMLLFTICFCYLAYLLISQQQSEMSQRIGRLEDHCFPPKLDSSGALHYLDTGNGPPKPSYEEIYQQLAEANTEISKLREELRRPMTSQEACDEVVKARKALYGD